MHALSGNMRGEREKCGLLPDTQGRLKRDRLVDLYVASLGACDGAGKD
jgi:hypothetical protein